ncbi:hypothetical protein CDL15_Pgr028561 [Punica granatum]|uniref:Nucleotide-diphospho-sugar transferase domain-containing protein n=1 Tax=Punica granatum TaxID=22663 RepID=A0A218VW88_PUNGR|nr:hypothetical protein CDL15_Pgr028561 [Punica granatum]
MKDNATVNKERDVLLDLMQRGTFRVLGLKARFLDTLYFSGFCTDSRDFGSATTMHANCRRIIVAKIFGLKKVLRDWKCHRFSKGRAGYARNRTIITSGQSMSVASNRGKY